MHWPTSAATIAAFVSIIHVSHCNSAPLPWPALRGALIGQTPLRRSLRSSCSDFRLQLGALVLVNLARRMRWATSTAPIVAFMLL
eukprot:2468196-Pyramimonas_sp.AAC.1